MDRLAHAQRYFDGWNAHDAEAIAATFAPGGTYYDPLVSVSTQTPRVRTRWAWPPRSPTSASSSSPGADGRWCGRCAMGHARHQHGSFKGLPATGREIALPGADFITFADDGSGIATVTGYFDSASVPRDLGLDVIVQPSTIGPGRSASPRARRRVATPRRRDRPDVPRGAQRRGGAGGARRARATSCTSCWARPDSSRSSA